MSDIIMNTPFSQTGGIARRVKDMGDGTFAEIVAVTGGTTTGGVSDTVWTDDSGYYFLIRDNGTTLTYVTSANTPYTPSTNIRPYSISPLQATATVLGSQSDTPATSDTGLWSLISLFKRQLANATTLLAKIPALVGGMVPVQAAITSVFAPLATSGSGTTSATASTSTNMLAANATRQFLLISNNGTATIYVCLTGAPASLTTGMQVPPGGTLVLDVKVSGAAITVFSTAVSQSYYLIEG